MMSFARYIIKMILIVENIYTSATQMFLFLLKFYKCVQLSTNRSFLYALPWYVTGNAVAFPVMYQGDACMFQFFRGDVCNVDRDFEDKAIVTLHCGWLKIVIFPIRVLLIKDQEHLMDMINSLVKRACR